MVEAEVEVLVGDRGCEGMELELPEFFLLQDFSEIPNFLLWLSKEGWDLSFGLEFLLAGFLLTRQRFNNHCKMSTS